MLTYMTRMTLHIYSKRCKRLNLLNEENYEDTREPVGLELLEELLDRENDAISLVSIT